MTSGPLLMSTGEAQPLSESRCLSSVQVRHTIVAGEAFDEVALPLGCIAGVVLAPLRLIPKVFEHGFMARLQSGQNLSNYLTGA